MGHHFSTDIARRHPQLDVTDVYAFASDRPGKTCMVLILNPKSVPGDENNFSPDALYKLHLGADRLHASGQTYTVRFGGGRAWVAVLQGAQDTRGLPGADVGGDGARLNEVTELPGDLRFWAGTVKDPFFGNQNGLREFREAISNGVLDLEAFQRHAGESPFTNVVSSAIVLEIPNSSLPPTIYYFGSVDWFDHGHWHRSNRVAYALVPHLYLFSATDEQRSSRHEHMPAQDHQHHGLAVSTIETYSRLAGAQADPSAYAHKMAEMLLPDTVPYKVGTPARYAVEGANGRALTDDAMDVALSWVVGMNVRDDVGQPDGRVDTKFPFVVPVV